MGRSFYGWFYWQSIAPTIRRVVRAQTPDALAAIHTAIAAINPDPGDEIVTSGITDMGALTPILYQGAIPVFADVDPQTYNITAKTLEPCLSDRTRAIIVTTVVTPMTTPSRVSSERSGFATSVPTASRALSHRAMNRGVLIRTGAPRQGRAALRGRPARSRRSGPPPRRRGYLPGRSMAARPRRGW